MRARPERLRGLRPPAPGQPGRRGRVLRGDRRVPRRAQPRAALPGEGQRRDGRRGHRGRAHGLERRRRRCGSRTTSTCPRTSIADIRQTSLLGEKYVVARGARGRARDGQLSDGDDIPLSQTGRNPELEEVLGALAFLLNGGGIGQMKTITTEINKVFDGRQDRVRHVLGELETLIGGLDEQKGDIIEAMEAMNGLSRDPQRARSETVTAAIDAFGPAVKVLADQHDGLMEMLRALDRLGVVGTRVINATKDDLLADLRHLQPVLHEIATPTRRSPRRSGCSSASRSRSSPTTSCTATTRTPRSSSASTSTTCTRTSSAGRTTAGTPRCPTSRGCPRSADLPGVPDVPDVPGGPDLPDLPDLPGLSGRTSATPQRLRHRPARAARRWSRMTGGVKRRLIAFVLLSAFGLFYASANYLGLVDRILGRGYTVTAELDRDRRPLRGQPGHLPRRPDRQGRVDGARRATGVAVHLDDRGRAPRSRRAPRCSSTTAPRWGSSTSTSSPPPTRARTSARATSSRAARTRCRSTRATCWSTWTSSSARSTRTTCARSSASSATCSTTPAGRCRTSSTAATR